MKENRKLENYKIAKIKFSRKMISREIVFLFVSLAISLTIFFVLLLPEYQKMKVMEFKINLVEDNLKYRKITAEKIENFNEKYKDIKTEDMDKIKSLLSDRNNLEEHLLNIDNSAKANGIIINDFSTSDSSKSSEPKSKSNDTPDNNSPEFKEVEITFSAKGVFSNFVLFLDSLEKNIPLINLSKLKIKKSETGDEETIEIMEIEETEIEGETKTETETETEIETEIEEDADVLEYDVTLLFYYL